MFSHCSQCGLVNETKPAAGCLLSSTTACLGGVSLRPAGSATTATFSSTSCATFSTSVPPQAPNNVNTARSAKGAAGKLLVGFTPKQPLRGPSSVPTSQAQLANASGRDFSLLNLPNPPRRQSIPPSGFSCLPLSASSFLFYFFNIIA